MAKVTLIYEEETAPGGYIRGSVTTLSKTDIVSLDELLELFTGMAKVCGYSVDGLEITEIDND